MSEPKTLPAAKTVVDSSIKLLKTYVDAANKLPTRDDYDYHSVFPGFVETMNGHKERLGKIVNTFVNTAVSPQRQRRLLSKAESRNHVLDVVDMMFENIDTLLDEVHGAKMSAEAQDAAFNNTAVNNSNNSGSVMDTDNGDDNAKESSRHSRSFAASSSAANAASSSSSTVLARKAPFVAIARPQLNFTRAVDNSEEPFRPLIFNAETNELSFGPAGAHPHKSLVETFAYTPDQLRYREELLPAPLSASNLHFVTSVADLDAMIATHLAPSAAIAIDLEHHDIHSYQGITCLMQISTRTDDFLVDVFPLRDYLHRLNTVFLNPAIVKVLHGCKEDVRWLQKDFGVYLCNVFDTGLALQTLHMPYSLAFAVDHYCQIKLNKQYQKADWRVRPLPADMVHYARQDTHYLLYIYDRLSNQLLQQEGGRAAVLGNLLVHVLNDSRQLCLLQYEKPAFSPKTSFMEGLGKALLGLTAAQTERARVVYNWRESVARAEDESPMAVMHASSVVLLATNPSFSHANLPTATQLLRAIHPLSMAVRSRIKGLVDALAEAYPAEEEAEGAHHRHGTNQHGGKKDGDGSAPTAGQQQQQRRQLRHYPLTGTLPSVVNRNTNAAAVMLGADAADDLTEVPDASSDNANANASNNNKVEPSPSPLMSLMASQRSAVATAATMYSSVLPPSSPCLAAKPVAVSSSTGSTVDSFGIVRPGARETVLQKVIREEKANAALGADKKGATTASSEAGAFDGDEITFTHSSPLASSPTAEAGAEEGGVSVGAKRPREGLEEEGEELDEGKPKGQEEEGEEEKNAQPKSLKETFGLGRQQRKKQLHNNK